MNTKIEGKFYPLQHEEWLKACQELTPAQRDVLYYIRTPDPYSNGIELSPALIARQLSTPTKQVHRSTVGRALKELDAKGFIDMELISVRVSIKSKGLLCVLPPDNNVASAQQARSPRNKRDRDATSAIATQQPEPETPNPEQSRHSKTYSDLIKTLLENERENFQAFCQKQAQKYPNEVVLLESWIAANFDELLGMYRKVYATGKSSTPIPESQNSEPEIHQSIVQALADGRITKLDPLYKGLWTADHGWMPESQWLEMFGDDG